MNKIIKIILTLFITCNISVANSSEKFFDEGLKLYNDKKNYLSNNFIFYFNF